ncbi:hypothetical protein Ga0061079_105190 [Apibacter mensalis]|uniref:Uncharacterized protein n=1 Tax=Apibacter mensalis TaxID=1586267 RepID=A0A0X3APB2_9FLAO|nr:hypothetical protein Ga0061079_105190 [Apibacter mensalis]
MFTLTIKLCDYEKIEFIFSRTFIVLSLTNCSNDGNHASG